MKNRVSLIANWIALVIAVVIVFVEVPFGLAAILVLGLIAGFCAPLTDVSMRVAFYVLAAALPMIADNFDAIPVVGTYLNQFFDNLAVGIAGAAIMNLLLVLYQNLIPQSSE